MDTATCPHPYHGPQLAAVPLLGLPRLRVQFRAVLHTMAEASTVCAALWRSAWCGTLLLLQQLHWILDRLHHTTRCPNQLWAMLQPRSAQRCGPLKSHRWSRGVYIHSAEAEALDSRVWRSPRLALLSFYCLLEHELGLAGVVNRSKPCYMHASHHEPNEEYMEHMHFWRVTQHG